MRSNGSPWRIERCFRKAGTTHAHFIVIIVGMPHGHLVGGRTRFLLFLCTISLALVHSRMPVGVSGQGLVCLAAFESSSTILLSLLRDLGLVGLQWAERYEEAWKACFVSFVIDSLLITALTTAAAVVPGRTPRGKRGGRTG